MQWASHSGSPTLPLAGLSVMLALLYPVVMRWGIVGVSWLSVIVAVIDFGVSATLVSKLVDAPWKAYAQLMIRPGVAAVVAGVISTPHLSTPDTSQDGV